jgi:arylsulfatase A-like enzyme
MVVKMRLTMLPLNRRDFLKTMALGGLTFTMSDKIPANKNNSEKPNILLILVDDLGYGDLGCYGASDIRSPNLDGLMASGVKFENFYANCPVCSPTRASIMTGCYPDMVGVPGVIRTHPISNFGYLNSNAVMLPKVLQQAGYDTAIIGKWHLGLESPNIPNEQGFDHFHGFLGDMMDDYYTHLRHDINYMRLNDQQIYPEGHATDLFTDWCIDFLKSRKNSDRPFFAYLAYNAPHTPIQPPQEWLESVLEREKGIDEKRAKLVALIEHMDYGIGRVLNALTELNLTDNTLVIFTSDNGGQLNIGASNGNLRGGKGQMYEGGIKEPMFAMWQGKINPGAISQHSALTMDIFPTICEAAGVDLHHEIDGRSILPAMLGSSQTDLDDRFIFWVRREGGLQYTGQAFYAVRQGQRKLLQNTPFEPLRLFDLRNDPKEDHPMPETRENRGELLNALQHHIIRTGAVPWQKYPVKF